MAALLVLLEALVEQVLQATGDAGLERMRQWEESVHILRAYRAGDVEPPADGDAP
jgi:DNA-binding MurR/RpiR family transcriptional regulator